MWYNIILENSFENINIDSIDTLINHVIEYEDELNSLILTKKEWNTLYE
jgi:hypothetical protein